jgi:polyisoprenyl-teichoic acid--peptidoglycan teichoic acid transferase
MARPRRRRLVLGVLGVVILILSAATLRLGWEWKQALNNVDAMIVPTVTLPTSNAPVEPRESTIALPMPTSVPTAVPDPGGPVNILLLGTDARLGEDISRTDAIILVRLDPRANRVSMLSLPRDLWVKIPGHGQARINAAYTIGESKLGQGYGPALVKETVSTLVGLPIHHFVLINFEGFKALIDKIGGISIDVPKAIDDPAYPTEDYSTIEVHFSAGRQFMDGERALIYARTRHADSDFGRIQRQQQVLMAIFDRVRTQGLLSQLTGLDDYTGTLRDYIRTDLSRNDMLALAGAGAQLHPDGIQRYSIDSDMLVMLKKPATFAADPKALKQLVNQLIGSSLVSAGGEGPSR